MFRMLKRALAAVVAAAALVAAVPAHAGVAAGEKPPAWTIKEVVNTTSVDVQTLQGRVVLLEIFRTW